MRRLVVFVLCLQSVVLLANTLDLRCGDDVCKVDVEHGARIVSWKVGGEEMLWMPSAPQKDDGKWRHGGIPIVWPWQGDEYPDGVTNGPLHGVAWQSPFKVVKHARTIDGGDEVVLVREDFGLRADYAIRVLPGELDFWFKTTNLGEKPRKFALSIHPYFYLSERNRATIIGLDGLRYTDWRDGFRTNDVWRGEMPVVSWLDHEFLSAGRRMSARIVEFASGRRIAVNSGDAAAFWVWNPGENWAKNGAALYGELPDDAWRHILSIEPSTLGMKDAKPLLPGESRVLTAVISKDDSL